MEKTEWNIGINRYIVGCKYPFFRNSFAISSELIDTQWDVNFIDADGNTVTGEELIDTQWDVNEDKLLDMAQKAAGINRYIVGCKYR